MPIYIGIYTYMTDTAKPSPNQETAFDNTNYENDGMYQHYKWKAENEIDLLSITRLCITNADTTIKFVVDKCFWYNFDRKEYNALPKNKVVTQILFDGDKWCDVPTKRKWVTYVPEDFGKVTKIEKTVTYHE